MSPEIEELFRCSYTLRQKLLQVLPKEAVDYIIQLIVQDSAHKKLLSITEEIK